MKPQYISQETIDGLCQLRADMEDLETQVVDTGEAHGMSFLDGYFVAFEYACKGALRDFFEDCRPEHRLRLGVTIEDLMEERGTFLILMTLEGHGVGIWDGDWDRFFSHPREGIPALQDHLEVTLGTFADCTGGGILSEQIRYSAYISLDLPCHESHAKALERENKELHKRNRELETENETLKQQRDKAFALGQQTSVFSEHIWED